MEHGLGGRVSPIFPNFFLPALLVAWGCSNDVVGPQPTLEPGVLPPTPNVVCQDQLTTSIQIHGTHFSPVPVDVPNGPRAALPDVTLTQLKTLAGAASDGSRI